MTLKKFEKNEKLTLIEHSVFYFANFASMLNLQQLIIQKRDLSEKEWGQLFAIARIPSP